MSSLLFVQGLFETGIRAAYSQLQSSPAAGEAESRATLEPSIRGLVSDFQTSEGSAAAVLPPALACLPQLSSPTSAAFQELSIFSDFYL